MSTAPRQTRQRAAVRDALTASGGFVSAQQLHDLLRRDGEQVGLTTVYRCLQALAAAGDVDQIVTDDGQTHYRACGPEHHHHLVCRNCGTTVEIAAATVESWAHQVGSEHGFADVSHRIELFGTCAACAHDG